MEIIIKVLNREREVSRNIIESIIDSEQNYLFTNDLDYKENKSEIVRPENNQNMGGQQQQMQQ